MGLAGTLRDTPETVSSIIDHTNVDPVATADEIRTLCDEVLEYGFCSACVVPYHAPLAADLLGNEANVAVVIGFPYGVQSSEAKRAEVRAIAEHVDEFDVVMNRTAFANGKDDEVVADVAAVREEVGNATLKVIIESPTLDPAEIRRAATLVEEGGADFVKTAVGYDGPSDAADVEAIAESVGDDTAIKASGGISTYEEVLEMVEAGASRIGASSGVDIYRSIP